MYSSQGSYLRSLKSTFLLLAAMPMLAAMVSTQLQTNQRMATTHVDNIELVIRGLHTSLVLHQGQHRIQLQRVVTTSLCACLHIR